MYAESWLLGRHKLEIRIVSQHLVDRHASGQKLQKIRHRIPQPANHRFAVSDLRV